MKTISLSSDSERSPNQSHPAKGEHDLSHLHTALERGLGKHLLCKLYSTVPYWVGDTDELKGLAINYISDASIKHWYTRFKVVKILVWYLAS